MRRNDRRVYGALALSIGGAFLLSSCVADPVGDNGSATAEPASFTFAFPQGNDAEDFYQHIAQRYMDETGAEIELLSTPGESYPSQVLTQLQAGNASDLLIVPPGSGQAHGALRLAEAGLVAPLGAYAEAVVPAESRDLYALADEIYALPVTLSPSALLWNPDGAADAGIGAFPETFDDLLDACVSATDAGKSLVALAGAVPANLGFLAQVIAATRVYADIPDWDAQRVAGNVSFSDSVGWRQTLADFVSMHERGCFGSGAAGAGFDAITNGMVGGASLSAAIPGSAAASFNAASDGALQIEVRGFPPAQGEPRVLASPLYTFAMNSRSEENAQEAVQDFLEWIIEPDNAAVLAERSGALSMVGGASLPQYEPIAELIEAGAFSSEPNLSWPNASVYEALGTGMQGLLVGTAQIDQVLADMDAAWDQ